MFINVAKKATYGAMTKKTIILIFPSQGVKSEPTSQDIVPVAGV